ncbi:phage/plasmid primase, P4 family [Maridesulfovibrio ferrireducens]|uniref:phage/plasmid primase, P4 family n=1 Tax=Maridesulfovibrio ferrireducens TaxID=246191 RepID=UPI001A24F53F|nr:phage/plasmid primase, P4 family [Maridesulfovibrio ferrireducens]MBI9110088.1 DNA primase [Maridesulfovibrio ferrireducens]
MGWAGTHLSEEERKTIARSLFEDAKEEGKWLNGKCPFHADDNPSFGYNFEDDYFKCLAGCTDCGDLIKLYSLVNGLPNDEGFTEFKKKFGQGVNDGPQSKTTVQQKRKPSKRGANVVIPESAWGRMALLPDDWFFILKKERGWNPDVIKRLDLRMQMVFRNSEGAILPVNGAPMRVAIPIRGNDGQLYNVRLYRKPGTNLKSKIISWGRGYGNARLFPAPCTLSKSGPVLLCEGEPDTICAISNGFSSITQTSKTAKWSKEHMEPFTGRDVIIAYDADQPGQVHAENAARSLVQVARSVRIIEWPEFMGRNADGSLPEKDGLDLTDFFVRFKQGAKDLQALFATARKVEIPQGCETGGEWAFFLDNRFKPRLLADQLLRDQPLLADDMTGLLYRWNSKYWEQISRGNLQQSATHYLGIEASTARVNDATSLAINLANLPHGRAVNDQGDWVCLQNGMLNLRTLELKPHDHDYYSTICLGVSFNPDSEAKCDRWLKYLADTVQTPEPIAQLQEFMGYSLTRDTHFEKCLLLLGDGSDGKSTFLNITRALVSPENCSAVAFQDLEDQFRRASLYNKLLNISTEIGSAAMETPIFKAVVSGDPIQGAFKHKDSFEFMPFCKLAFAANKLPRVLDNTDGFFRRMLPIKFKRQYLEGDPDRNPNLFKELVANELSEIFHWALVGLHRLYEQGRFSSSDETIDLLMDYRRLNNPVQAFVEDKCELADGAKEAKDSLYKAYREYCSLNGYQAMHKENFFRELYSAVKTLRETRPRVDGRRCRMISGIKTKFELTA